MTPSKSLQIIADALRNLMSELSGELEARYPESTRKQFPSQQQRFERDMSAVEDGRKALALIPDIEAGLNKQEEFVRRLNERRGKSILGTSIQGVWLDEAASPPARAEKE